MSSVYKAWHKNYFLVHPKDVVQYVYSREDKKLPNEVTNLIITYLTDEKKYKIYALFLRNIITKQQTYLFVRAVPHIKYWVKWHLLPLYNPKFDLFQGFSSKNDQKLVNMYEINCIGSNRFKLNCELKITMATMLKIR